MTHYIGLDAHSKTCTGVVLDGRGKIFAERQFPTTEHDLIGFVDGVKRPRALAFEEAGLAQWLFVLLKDHVDDLAVANASALPKQRGPKNDRRDAFRLAEELRAGRVSRVFHEASKLWDLRMLVSSYLDFTRDLVRAKNRYKSFFLAHGTPKKGVDVYTDASLLKTIRKEPDHFVAVNMFETIRVRQEVKDSYEERFEAIGKHFPVIGTLCSIPGISTIRASIIASIICSPERFANKHKLWAYAMLVLYFDESDGKIYGTRRPHGCSELKSAFMGAATRNLQSTNSLRRYYDRLRTKGVSDKNAKRALARRIAAIALMCMKTGIKYNDHHDDKRRRLENKKA